MKSLINIYVRLDTDILELWKQNQQTFPRLSIIPKAYLSIPATNTPRERSFSISGHTLQKRGSVLSPSTVFQILFIKYNSA